jgi:hypothetical protein
VEEADRRALSEWSAVPESGGGGGRGGVGGAGRRRGRRRITGWRINAGGGAPQHRVQGCWGHWLIGCRMWGGEEGRLAGGGAVAGGSRQVGGGDCSTSIARRDVGVTGARRRRLVEKKQGRAFAFSITFHVLRSSKNCSLQRPLHIVFFTPYIVTPYKKGRIISRVWPNGN